MRASVRTQDDKTVTVRVPITIRQHGGRKRVFSPDGREVSSAPVSFTDNATVRAFARAFRWREMLEDGTHATIAEIARLEKTNESYVCRVLRLTLLAPDIIETILQKPQLTEMKLATFFRGVDSDWQNQRDVFGPSI